MTPATARPGGGGEAVSHRSIAVQPRPPPARYPALATAPIEVRGRPSDDLKIHDVSAPSYKPAVKSFNWRKYLPKDHLGSGLGVKGEASASAVGQPVPNPGGGGQMIEDPNATRRRRHAEKQGTEMLKDYMAGGMGVTAAEPARMRASSLGGAAGRTETVPNPIISAHMFAKILSPRKTTLVPKRTFGPPPALASKYFSRS